MSVLYRNNIIFKNSCKILISFPRFRKILPFSTVITENTPPKTPFVVDYLINKCGLSREKSVKASTNLVRIQSPGKPDSVLSFLRDCDLSDTQIKHVISWRPKLLSANVEKTLVPKVRILQELGLSGPGLAEFIALKPWLLVVRAEPFINFLRSLLASKEDVIKTLKRSNWFCNYRNMQTNISILRNYGVSDQLIAKLVTGTPNFFFQNQTRLMENVNRVEKMGLTYQNGMFIHALTIVGALSKLSLETKFQLFKSFGWSEADILSAFARCPAFLKYSERRIRKMMDYFTKELEYESSYVALYPKLFSYSLEKRIIPRLNVLSILRAKELVKKRRGLYALVRLPEKQFLEQLVHPHKETAPEVFKAYMGRCMRERLHP